MLNDILVIFLIQFLLVMLPAPGLAKMFEKAGVAPSKAWMPFYNTWVILETAHRPKHWFFWQFIPVVGWFITMGIYIEWVKTFGKFGFLQHTAAALVPFFYFPAIGYDRKERFGGAKVVHGHRKSAAREWIDAGIFAIVAATLIRTFVFEAYTIPTGSMEKTLLVNDFLFVSKLSYGPRLPNTPLAVPFVHHTIPGTNARSYSELIHIPYRRWFAAPVKRNDVVVFNFPAGDTVINREGFQSEQPYYQVLREPMIANGDVNAARKFVLDHPEQFPLVVRPVDKRENYIKRCVGIAGDTIEIRDAVIYVNGKATEAPPKSQMSYVVVTSGQLMDKQTMLEEYDVDITKKPSEFNETGRPNEYTMLLTMDAKQKMLSSGLAKSITPVLNSPYPVYPYDTLHRWNEDNFGPLWIPKKGATLTLTPENYSLYERAIRVYEHNKLEMRDGKFYINDQPTNQYTFKMDYYWLMGDNRHSSQDSRFWGFVPEDHVVGEAWLIWMSYGDGIRWKRLFRTIN
ncbi:MAG TPA: S26 family signal peptidase [Chitinophagaceae bacterium]|nr:S26 family signal peptidase [Chitinophagaceae bacterium]